MNNVFEKEELQYQMENIIAVLESINAPDIKLALFEQYKSKLIQTLENIHAELIFGAMWYDI